MLVPHLFVALCRVFLETGKPIMRIKVFRGATETSFTINPKL